MQWSPEDAAVRRFLDHGWEEVDTLGRGARGPVVSIRRNDGTGPICALKRSSHHEVQALKALAVCRHEQLALVIFVEYEKPLVALSMSMF
eukprot:Skav226123  [mRNA]  locus=scaffold1047:204439:211230:- [translate_table: standard]